MALRRWPRLWWPLHIVQYVVGRSTVRGGAIVATQWWLHPSRWDYEVKLEDGEGKEEEEEEDEAEEAVEEEEDVAENDIGRKSKKREKSEEDEVGMKAGSGMEGNNLKREVKFKFRKILKEREKLKGCPGEGGPLRPCGMPTGL